MEDVPSKFWIKLLEQHLHPSSTGGSSPIVLDNPFPMLVSISYSPGPGPVS